MPRNLIPSDVTIKPVCSGDPRRRLTDGDGLYLLLFVNGGAHGWQLDYSFQGRRTTLSLGTYPSTTLTTLPAYSKSMASMMKAESVEFLPLV